MYTYIIRRLGFGAVTVVGVSIVVFLVLRVLPGDPLVAIFGTGGLHQAQRGRSRRLYGAARAERPAGRAVSRWIGDIATGSFGRSFFRSESVAEMIARRGPLTAEIALIAVVLSWVAGIPVAIVSALQAEQHRRQRFRDFSASCSWRCRGSGSAC